MKITVQREGYEVTAEVYGVSGSPYGLKASLEIDSWEGEITDPAAFKAEHNLEPSDDSLDLVMAMEETAIIDAVMEDAYDRAGERGGLLMNTAQIRKELGEIATKLATLNVAAQDMGLAESDRDRLDYLLSSCVYLADQANAMAGKLLVEQLTDSDRAQADEAAGRA